MNFSDRQVINQFSCGKGKSFQEIPSQFLAILTTWALIEGRFFTHKYLECSTYEEIKSNKPAKLESKAQAEK